MTSEQKQKLAELFAKEHVAVLITHGDPWPTGTMQAFAETDNLDLLFIMGATADKFQNLLKNPHATVLVDTRDVGKVATFEIARASVRGVASEVQQGTSDWESLKAMFLKKNPFEQPFFGNPALRMVRIAPKRISYANGLKDSFKLEL